jgi:GMP synthase (glutamine-hydrolysing)
MAALEFPLLGICYGLQVLAFDMGGAVQPSPNREFGYARLKRVDEKSALFRGLPN